MKNIKQIQHDIAKEAKFANWDLFIRSERYKPSLIDNKWTLVCERFANQFQVPSDALLTEIMVLREKNSELVEMLKCLYNSDGWMSPEAHTKIQLLINSNIKK